MHKASQRHAKDRKAYQGSIQVSSTNESGVCALALPHTWVLLRTWTVGKSKGRPFYVQNKGQLFPTCVSYAGYAHQREESPAIALSYCFSVFCFCLTGLFASADLGSRGEKRKIFFMRPVFPASFVTMDGKKHLVDWMHHLQRSFLTPLILISSSTLAILVIMKTTKAFPMQKYRNFSGIPVPVLHVQLSSNP